MKLTYLFFIVSLFFFSCKNDEIQNFVINGKLNNKFSGTIYLIPENRYLFSENTQLRDSTQVVNGVFRFVIPKRNKVILPYRFYFNRIRTQIFFLETEDQKIVVNENNVKITLLNKFTSNINKDYEFFDSINENFTKQLLFTKDSLKLCKNQNLNIKPILSKKKEIYYKNLINEILKLSKKNPSSLICLREISQFDFYDKDLENAFYNLSDSLQKSNVGKNVKNNIHDFKKMEFDMRFPDMNLVDFQNNKINLNFNYFNKNEFTLIEFRNNKNSYFNSEQNELKKLYMEYRDLGLDYIIIYFGNPTEIVDNTNFGKVYFYLDKQETKLLDIDNLPVFYLINNFGRIRNKNHKIESIKNDFRIYLE